MMDVEEDGRICENVNAATGSKKADASTRIIQEVKKTCIEQKILKRVNKQSKKETKADAKADAKRLS
jgi:hypothetical protein